MTANRLNISTPNGGHLTLWDWGPGYMPVLTGTFPDGYPVWARIPERKRSHFVWILLGKASFMSLGGLDFSPYVNGEQLEIWHIYNQHKMFVPLYLLIPFAERLRELRRA